MLHYIWHFIWHAMYVHVVHIVSAYMFTPSLLCCLFFSHTINNLQWLCHGSVRNCSSGRLGLDRGVQTTSRFGALCLCAYVYMVCFALSLSRTQKYFDRYAIVALVHRSACNWSSSELGWVLLEYKPDVY